MCCLQPFPERKSSVTGGPNKGRAHFIVLNKKYIVTYIFQYKNITSMYSHRRRQKYIVRIGGF